MPVPCPPHTTDLKLMTKIDWRLMPFLCILYLLAFLDRVNIANANVLGLSRDLGLDQADPNATQYNTALVIFFVPYILFEIPSNVLLKKFRPHVWLSACMFGFGTVTTLQGIVQGYSGLLATRFFLGVFEAGMFPGCFYLIGMWYKRTEAQRRFTFFFSSTTLAGAFGGLLAAAIGKMDGVGNVAGWRWVGESTLRPGLYCDEKADLIVLQVFILEGLLTVVVSWAFFFLLPDFPEDAKVSSKSDDS